MKKLLTILGAIGLTVTTSTAVVSCATKKIEFTFEDFASVNSTTWNGGSFGAFYQDDFDFSDPNIGTIKNKEKMAAYVAAGFKNYKKVYDKIANQSTTIFVYRKNTVTGEYANLQQADLTGNPLELFFCLTDTSTRKSSYLELNFNPNQAEKIFDLDEWFNNSLSGLTIKVKEVEDQLKGNSDDELRQKDLQIMQNLKEKVVNAWKTLKNGSLNPMNAAERATVAVFNYLGEYLVRTQDYVSSYLSSSIPPLTIKQQLKNALMQNSEWKNKTWTDLYEDWGKVENISNGELLPFKFNYLDQTVTINFDFSDK